MRFVTSLSPGRIERQLRCIDSWAKYGLEIVAVQTERESDSIESLYKMVSVVRVPERANAWGRPHLPRIVDVINQCDDGPIVIINSDIEITDSVETFRDQWMTERDGLVLGIRRDYTEGSTPKLTPYGIDAFKITPELWHIFDVDAGFCIGAPGWDYWVPFLVWREKLPIVVSSSVLLHENHAMAYSSKDIKIAYQLLTDDCLMPGESMSVLIQHITGRTGMRRTVADRKARR